jgi:hypothetical protein
VQHIVIHLVSLSCQCGHNVVRAEQFTPCMSGFFLANAFEARDSVRSGKMVHGLDSRYVQNYHKLHK